MSQTDPSIVERAASAGLGFINGLLRLVIRIPWAAIRVCVPFVLMNGEIPTVTGGIPTISHIALLGSGWGLAAFGTVPLLFPRLCAMDRLTGRVFGRDAQRRLFDNPLAHLIWPNYGVSRGLRVQQQTSRSSPAVTSPGQLFTQEQVNITVADALSRQDAALRASFTTQIRAITEERDQAELARRSMRRERNSAVDERDQAQDDLAELQRKSARETTRLNGELTRLNDDLNSVGTQLSEAVQRLEFYEHHAATPAYVGSHSYKDAQGRDQIYRLVLFDAKDPAGATLPNGWVASVRLRNGATRREIEDALPRIHAEVASGLPAGHIGVLRVRDAAMPLTGAAAISLSDFYIWLAKLTNIQRTQNQQAPTTGFGITTP